MNVSGKMYAAMQDVDLVAKHCYDSFVLGTMTIINKGLDVIVEFVNKGEEANERVGTSIFDDSSAKAMHRIGLITAQH